MLLPENDKYYYETDGPISDTSAIEVAWLYLLFSNYLIENNWEKKRKYILKKSRLNYISLPYINLFS